MNMFFIFGWGHLTRKQYDSGIERECPQCHNPARMILLHVKKWFTFFFIPVIPYGTEYFLACPTCGHALMLTKTQFHEIRDGTADTSGWSTVSGTSGPRESDATEGSSGVVVCPNCSAEVELSEFDLKARKYVCPTCNSTVRWEPRR